MKKVVGIQGDCESQGYYERYKVVSDEQLRANRTFIEKLTADSLKDRPANNSWLNRFEGENEDFKALLVDLIG